MNRLLIRKMIKRSLKDYLWEEENCTLTDEEWRNLEEEVLRQINEEGQNEAIYSIIQDVVYAYFTNK
ncbi:YqzH family protein [Fictibacillus phosphorivorans]|uniref:YqzH family protein n=1 Tax=Fictibacillus phosphorivorans TaxID=1221500 RepID=UPI0018E6DCC6